MTVIRVFVLIFVSLTLGRAGEAPATNSDRNDRRDDAFACCDHASLCKASLVHKAKNSEGAAAPLLAMSRLPVMPLPRRGAALVPAAFTVAVATPKGAHFFSYSGTSPPTAA